MEGRPTSRVMTPASSADVKMVYICGGKSSFIHMNIYLHIFISVYLILYIIYTCTLDCGAENSISSKDAIRCRECGYRIMYKKRTNRSKKCFD